MPSSVVPQHTYASFVTLLLFIFYLKTWGLRQKCEKNKDGLMTMAFGLRLECVLWTMGWFLWCLSMFFVQSPYVCMYVCVLSFLFFYVRPIIVHFLVPHFITVSAGKYYVGFYFWLVFCFNLKSSNCFMFMSYFWRRHKISVCIHCCMFFFSKEIHPFLFLSFLLLLGYIQQ